MVSICFMTTFMKSPMWNGVPSLVVIVNELAEDPVAGSGVGEARGIVFLGPAPCVPTGLGTTGLVI